MKDLSGRAEATVAAPRETSLALAEAVEAYPSWYPEVVKAVDVLERNPEGTAAKVQTRLHLAHGRLKRDFELTMAVEVRRPDTVRLARIPNERGDEERFEVVWTLADRRIALQLDAVLPVPRMLPVRGLGDSVARGFIDAAVRALRA